LSNDKTGKRERHRHKSSATSAAPARSAGRIAWSRSSLSHNRRLPSVTRGLGYSSPTLFRNASTVFSPQYAAAKSTPIRRGHDPAGIAARRRDIAISYSLSLCELYPPGKLYVSHNRYHSYSSEPLYGFATGTIDVGFRYDGFTTG